MNGAWLKSRFLRYFNNLMELSKKDPYYRFQSRLETMKSIFSKPLNYLVDFLIVPLSFSLVGHCIIFFIWAVDLPDLHLSEPVCYAAYFFISAFILNLLFIILMSTVIYPRYPDSVLLFALFAERYFYIAPKRK